MIRALMVVAAFASMPSHPGMPSGDPSGATTSGSGGHHAAIAEVQELVDRAGDGARVVVPAGTYHGALVLDRRLILVGEGVTIDAGGHGSVVTITAAGATLRGFSLRASGFGPVGQPSGVTVLADRVRVEEVAIADVYTGITVRGARGVVLEGNEIQGREAAVVTNEMHVAEDGPAADHAPSGGDSGTVRGDGISLWDTVDTRVLGNRIRLVRDGVFISYGDTSRIEANTVSESRYAIHAMFPRATVVRANELVRNLSGIVLMYGGPVLVEANTIRESGSASTGFGILVKDAGDVQLERNVIASDRIGIHLDNGSATGGSATILENTIALNQIGLQLLSASQATFSGNGFVENVAHVVADGGDATIGIRWSEADRGNFWTSYRGYDGNGDGVGDVAYRESGQVDALISRAPVLAALSSGPALRFLEAVADRWDPRAPSVLDPAPPMAAVSPPVPDGAERAGVALVAPALAVVAACAWALRRGRRVA